MCHLHSSYTETHARKIIRYRKQSNWLICTMAVMNILVNTIFTNTISLLLENRKYGEILKYAVPTILIVLLAEILPQVREVYSEDKLKALIKVQSKKMEEAAQGDILARIADFPKKTIEDMMTPMEDAFIISGSDRLDLLVTILEKGFTRIPVFEEKNRFNLFAMLNVKDLATLKFEHRSTVQQFMSMVDVSRTQMRFVLAAQRGESLMYEMMKGDHHLCGVIRFSYGRYRVVGLITFEDVIEEVFGDIETVFEACPLLMTLGYDVLRLKALLSPDNLFHAKEDELLEPRNNRKMLIFFNGTITVSGGRTTTYRLDANRADFRPYIWGKCLVKRVFKVRLYTAKFQRIQLSLPLQSESNGISYSLVTVGGSASMV
ncbi:unnamed protein product [Heligmosomoides polygyrus]|uniref:CNNM transmembrane domain-containing protein n=1 Tax=Heligmosomoides polygyrus TaxID=6339 RepID=A0A183FY36_HELPZ|nr:unnamed protein product [Heligmosomoides polygyrus]